MFALAPVKIAPWLWACHLLSLFYTYETEIQWDSRNFAALEVCASCEWAGIAVFSQILMSKTESNDHHRIHTVVHRELLLSSLIPMRSFIDRTDILCTLWIPSSEIIHFLQWNYLCSPGACCFPGLSLLWWNCPITATSPLFLSQAISLTQDFPVTRIV